MKIDCHIHLERGSYTLDWLNQFVETAVRRGMDEIYLLEHSFRFHEFSSMYRSVCDYSGYQRNWFEKRRRESMPLEDYIKFVEHAKQMSFPIKVKFGLEICYFEEYESYIRTVLNHYSFDFLTGSVHWVDGFGFDHKAEFWNDKNVDEVYIRYYEIMENLVKSKLFTGVAHPDSIKAFGHKPSFNLTGTYEKLAELLCENDMYAEQSGGLRLNYSSRCELGMNASMLRVFIDKGVRILTASDAHRPEDVGANIEELQLKLSFPAKFF